MFDHSAIMKIAWAVFREKNTFGGVLVFGADGRRDFGRCLRRAWLDAHAAAGALTHDAVLVERTAAAAKPWRRREPLCLPLLSVSPPAPRRAVAEPAEHPWQRVRRLSAELSQALAHADVGGFYAEVYPACDKPRPITFVATDTMDKLQEAIRVHHGAYARLVRGEEQCCSDRRLDALIGAEDRAFLALLALPCPSLSAVQLKAYYIERARPGAAEKSLTAEEAAALLRSLHQ